MARLGGTMGYLAQTLRPLSQGLANVMQVVDASDVGVRNSRAWSAAQTARGSWEKFTAELEADASAR